MGGQAVYFPVKEIYDTKPNYFPLGKDLGNGVVDSQLFQIDDFFLEYRATKMRQRENLERYVQRTPDSILREGVVARFIIDRLLQDHPSYFTWRSDGFTRELDCKLTGETLMFDSDLRLLEPRYRSSLDALGMQIQEDFAVLTVENGRNWLSYTHVNLPSGWRPQEKIGKSFAQIHADVPGMERVNENSQQMLETFLSRNISNMRFLWLLGFGNELSGHPAHTFAKSDELYLRIERQGFFPMPEASSFLFTIRIYRYPCEMMPLEHLERIHAAFFTMEPAIREYKDPADVEVRMRALETLIQKRS